MPLMRCCRHLSTVAASSWSPVVLCYRQGSLERIHPYMLHSHIWGPTPKLFFRSLGGIPDFPSFTLNISNPLFSLSATPSTPLLPQFHFPSQFFLSLLVLRWCLPCQRLGSASHDNFVLVYFFHPQPGSLKPLLSSATSLSCVQFHAPTSRSRWLPTAQTMIGLSPGKTVTVCLP